MFFRKLIFVLIYSATLAPAFASDAYLYVKTISQDGFKAKYNLLNTSHPGICIEIMRAIERIDPDIKFIGLEHNASILRIENQLEQGEIDVFLGT